MEKASESNIKDKIRIANAGGYWGDDTQVLKRQILGGELDYISIDYLSEITMSILSKQKNHNPKSGFVQDFIDQVVDCAKLLSEKKIKLITNAGGVEVLLCAKKLCAELLKLNVNLKVAVVEGDGIVDRIKMLQEEGETFKNIETGESFDLIQDRLVSANVYFGSRAIVNALEHGADIIITGRVTDTALTMAPMIYEFGWKINEFDKLAAGMVAGHIIECGAQSSGGNYTDWHLIKNWYNIGYPIVEMKSDGKFSIYKHPDTGGLINTNTIKEQLLYEMGNPRCFIGPDLVADISKLKISQSRYNRINIENTHGQAPTPYLKVSMAYNDGYKAVGYFIVCGEEIDKKAKIIENIIWDKLKIDFEDSNLEIVGYNSCHKYDFEKTIPLEAMLRISVFDMDQEKVKQFCDVFAATILSAPSGIAIVGAKPKIQKVVSYWPCLIDKRKIEANLFMLNCHGEVESAFKIPSHTQHDKEWKPTDIMENKAEDDLNKSHLNNSLVETNYKKICLARSGDKGDSVNIGVVARDEKKYKYLKKNLTESKMKEIFEAFCYGNVIRYDIPNLLSFNFILERSLGGGGTKSLRIDPQGKIFAELFLNYPIELPEDIIRDE
ncbi:MAG: DUF1446 domain-containing protein [Marinifilaceae bacterium]|jgi:hypothetical protein|nr:DUF1446 domain-containing protein [Marinifilaceae bacterium]